MLQDRAKDFDVLVLTETLWDPDSDIILPGYNHLSMAKKCKKHKYGGIHGICIFVRDAFFLLHT